MDEVGSLPIYHLKGREFVESVISTAELKISAVAKQCMEEINAMRREKTLSNLIDIMNYALEEVSPVCAYWENEAVQNFRDSRSLPGVHYAYGKSERFSLDDFSGGFTPRLAYFVFGASQVIKYGASGLESLNGVSLSTLSLHESPEQSGKPSFRTIEGITRRKIYRYELLPAVESGSLRFPTSPKVEDVSDFLSHVKQVLDALMKYTRSDYVMSRGFRPISSLCRAIATDSWNQLLNYDMYSHYCWVRSVHTHGVEDRCTQFHPECATTHGTYSLGVRGLLALSNQSDSTHRPSRTFPRKLVFIMMVM